MSSTYDYTQKYNYLVYYTLQTKSDIGQLTEDYARPIKIDTDENPISLQTELDVQINEINRQHAKDYIKGLISYVNALSEQPFRGRLLKASYFKRKGMRRIDYNNIAIFYTIDRNKKSVDIVVVGYASENWDSILRQVIRTQRI